MAAFVTLAKHPGGWWRVAARPEVLSGLPILATSPALWALGNTVPRATRTAPR